MMHRIAMGYWTAATTLVRFTLDQLFTTLILLAALAIGGAALVGLSEILIRLFDIP